MSRHDSTVFLVKLTPSQQRELEEYEAQRREMDLEPEQGESNMPVPDGVTTADTRAESKHIKAEDFKIDQKLKLKVSDVNLEQMPARDGKPARNRFTLSFLGKEKGLVLNATNQGFIEARLGTKPNAWIGAEIVLHRTTTTYAGQIVPAFRIIECRKGEPPPQEPGSDSEDF